MSVNSRMRNPIIVVLVLLLSPMSALAEDPAKKPPPQWSKDLRAAKRRAAATNKSLLIVFTYGDTKRLPPAAKAIVEGNRTIEKNPEFRTRLAKVFEYVRFDHQDTDRQRAAIRAELVQRYGIGHPFVIILADAKGNPYARIYGGTSLMSAKDHAQAVGREYGAAKALRTLIEKGTKATDWEFFAGFSRAVREHLIHMWTGYHWMLDEATKRTGELKPNILRLRTRALEEIELQKLVMGGDVTAAARHLIGAKALDSHKVLEIGIQALAHLERAKLYDLARDLVNKLLTYPSLITASRAKQHLENVKKRLPAAKPVEKDK